MTDLRKAAEMALEYLEYLNELDIAGLDHEVHTNALRQALAQPEQKKEPTPSNVDPRVLLISDSDFTKETGNRLCDIERRLAAIETQPNEANKKPHAVSYKDGVPVAHYKFDSPPYTAPPSKPWVGLTDEEIYELRQKTFDGFATNHEVYRAIEDALRKKNDPSSN